MHIIRLEQRRIELQAEMALVGRMRRGTIHVSSRKCRNYPCLCHMKGHPGHDRINTYTEVVEGMPITTQYPKGQEWEKVKAEVANYHHYCALSEEYVEVVNAISDYDSAPGTAALNTRWDVPTLKKNSRTYFKHLLKKKQSTLHISL